MKTRFQRVLWILGIASAIGCDRTAEPSEPGASPALTAHEAVEAESEAAVNEPETPADALERKLLSEAERHAQFMIPLTPVHRGELAEGENHDVQVVFPGGHCYKVIATGRSDVARLELMLLDPLSTPIQRSEKDGATPVLGIEPICLEGPGAYRVQVKMVRGRGKFAMRVYRSR